ncbi:MAG TPA: hypothetical protein VD761_10215 [Solirubrobacterales bacterium]|nr:hypothetical protein [Solirubrobacterales bacterium]
MKSLARLAAVLMMLGLAAPATSQAEFGFADVNTGLPGDPAAPAFPGTKALWAGTCDLSSASTANGGVGEAPTIRPHCIDLGDSTEGGLPGNDTPWPVGAEPDWRLEPVTQAAAHPDATAAFLFNYDPRGTGSADGSVKNIIVKLPPGVVGSPTTLPYCSALAVQAIPPACGAETQAGMSTLTFGDCADRGECHHWQTRPVYNAEPRDTITAEFTIASISEFFNVPITARGRTNGDYGVDTLALLIPDFVPLGGQAFTFWGVPWAKEHDKFRMDGLEQGGHEHVNEWHLTGVPEEFQRSYEPGWGTIKPFFTNPTECSGQPLPITIDMDSWQNPVSRGGPLVSGTALTDVLTGCDKLEFDPSIALKPTTSVADSPAGLDVHLSTPQNNEPPASTPDNPDLAHDPADDTGAPAYWKSPAGIAAAHLKNTAVTLPRGTSFNPAAANGLNGCTTEQIGLTATKPKVTFNNDPITCPDTSEIGTLEINSPLLNDPLFGAVYVAPQDDNPFPGTLTAIYLVSQDEERGLSIKLPGRVDLDPRTGQISTTFLDNPQLPFNDLTLHLKTGPRAPLNTPPVCGHFENAADMTPWSFPASGPQPTFHDPFDIATMPNGLACVTEPEDRVFGPGFTAGSSSSQAGAHTDLVLNVTRQDGHQELSALNLDTPPGLTAKLSDTPFCPEGAIASVAQKTGLEETQEPSCPPKSLVGVVNSLAGAGPLPLPTAGKLYFAGPYDPDGGGPLAQAPLSVAAVVPAIAGGSLARPAFDLGNLVVRSAVYVDPDDAGVHILAGNLPYIVGGVPLRVRKISVEITKPSFMLNPTNCSEFSIGGRIGGAADPLDPADDTTVAVSNRFQVGGCEKLGFRPKLKLRLIGGTKRGENPRLRAELRPRPGDANLAAASVTLPHSAFLDNAHIGTICTRVQFAAEQCPARSVYGHARAFTPLLAEPLEGPVYLKSSDNELPDMVAALDGIIDLDVAGRIDGVRGGRLRNIFDLVPDAPVTKFVLTLRGGKRGLITNSRNICKTVNRGAVKLTAQNGLVRKFRPIVDNSCQKKAGGKKRGKSAKGKHGNGNGKGKKQHGRS